MDVSNLPTKLQLLYRVGNGENVSQNRLSKRLGVTEARVSQIIKEVNEEGNEQDLIRVDRSTRPHILYLTETGQRFTGNKLIKYLDEAPAQKPLNSSALRSGSDRGLVKLHNFVVKAEIQNTDELLSRRAQWFNGEDWCESWMEKEGLSFEEDDRSHGYVVTIGGVTVRFTRENVFIRMGHFYGTDVNEVKERSMSEAREKVRWLNDCTPVKVESKFGIPMFSVNQQEIASVRDAFAEMVVQHDGTDLRDFRVYDEEGNLRMWVDDSDGERHLETGSPSDWSEDDLHFYKDDVIGFAIRHKDEWRGLQALLSCDRDVARIPETLDRLSDLIDSVSGRVRRNRDEFFGEVAEQNDRIRDAVERVEGVQRSQYKYESVLSEVAERNEDLSEQVTEVRSSNAEVLSQMVELQSAVSDSIEVQEESSVKESKMLDVIESQVSYQAETSSRVGSLEDRMERKNDQIQSLLEEVKCLREDANTGFWDRAKSFGCSVKNRLSGLL